MADLLHTDRLKDMLAEEGLTKGLRLCDSIGVRHPNQQVLQRATGGGQGPGIKGKGGDYSGDKVSWGMGGRVITIF